jgi:hypothetical protein
LGARSGPKQKNLECSFAEKLQVKVKHKTIYASGIRISHNVHFS